MLRIHLARFLVNINSFRNFSPQGENIMHSTGTSKSEAEVRAGLAFSVVQTHLNALKVEQGAAAAASADRDLLDVGQFKILLMQ